MLIWGKKMVTYSVVQAQPSNPFAKVSVYQASALSFENRHTFKRREIEVMAPFYRTVLRKCPTS
jgi:hypothetical protein